MKVDLKGSVFVITGKLTKMNRYDAEAAIERVGGKTADSVTKKTDYLIVGERPSSKYTKARNMGIPILTEDDFKALIAGEAVEVEAIGEAGDRSVSELLGEVRSVMQGSPSAQMWSELIKLLDACRADDVHVLTDYIDSYIARWSEAQMRGEEGSGIDLLDHRDLRTRWWYERATMEAEVRVAPEHWVGEMQQGIDSPKYKVVRALDFTHTKVSGAVIEKILGHPSLLHVELLALPQHVVPSTRLIKRICLTSTLRCLHLGKIDEGTAPAFHDHGAEATPLQIVDLKRFGASLRMEDGDAICAFARVPYFSTVTTLFMEGNSYYDRMFVRSMHDARLFPNVTHVLFDGTYNVAPLLNELLGTSWARERLKAITIRRGPDHVDRAVLKSWEDVLNRRFTGHLEVLDLSSFGDAHPHSNASKQLTAMFHRVLPTARLLEHVDALILGEWKTGELGASLEDAFPALTVK